MAANKEEKIKITLPRAGKNEDPNLFVGINGKNYLVPKGKTSEVPKAVYDEIMRAQRAEEALYAYVDAAAEQAK